MSAIHKLFMPSLLFVGLATAAPAAVDAAAVEKKFSSYLSKKLDAYLSYHTAAALKQVAANPADPEARNELGVAYARIGLIPEALSNFELLKADAKWRLFALNNIANCHTVLGQDAEAIKAYQLILAEEPEHLYANLNLAILYHQRFDLTNAMARYAVVKRLDGGLAGKYEYLARAQGGEQARAAEVGAGVSPYRLSWKAKKK